MVAARHFPADVLLAREEPGPRDCWCSSWCTWRSSDSLQQRTAAGDRSVPFVQVLHFAPPVGRFEVTWDDDRGALLVHLDAAGAPAEGGRDGRLRGGRR
ncbi:MAG: hypothetical protein R2734_08590 [Nocardioides sp.]